MMQATKSLLRTLALAVAALALLLAPTLLEPGARAETPVDVELVLAVDISLSMDPEEQRLQRNGYIQALRDPEIMRAIRAGPHGRIAVTYVEWAGPDIQIHLIPWRLIDGPASAESFIAELSAKEYSRYRRTSVSAALEYSARQFGTGPYRGARRVIDVSGDGANNSGPPLGPIRDRIVEAGIIINGLPILLRPTMAWNGWDVPDLDRYYAHCVIGGPGSFSIPITKLEEFATATRQKLLLEISSLPAPPRFALPASGRPRAVPVQDGAPGSDVGYDCTMVERGIRRW